MAPEEELALRLEKEMIEHTTRSEERWKEQWRWKEGVEDRLKDTEERVTTVAKQQATDAAEMKAQIRGEVRWSSFFGTLLAGAALAGVGLVMRLIVGHG